MTLDAATAAAHVDRSWDDDIVPVLHDYIRIPNVSVAYDATWDEAGHMAQATDLLRDWCQRHVDEHLEGAKVEVQHIDGRTPLLLVDVPAAGDGAADDTVLLYGHLDKQPPIAGWRDGLGPWEPVVDGDRLYGRGGADDGYSTFAALTALEAVRAAGGSHARCVVAHRGERGVGQPRPARPPRRCSATASASRRSSSPSTRGAATTTGCGSRRRCAASST